MGISRKKVWTDSCKRIVCDVTEVDFQTTDNELGAIGKL